MSKQTVSSTPTMPVIMVPFSDFHVPDSSENTSRWAAPVEGKVDQLAQNIKDRADLKGVQMGEGLLQPVLVSPNMGEGEIGSYTLRAGFQRMEALKKLQVAGESVTEVLAHVIDASTPQDGQLVNLDENIVRNEMTLMDQAHAATFLKASGMNNEAIAAKFGHKKAWAGTVLRLMTLPDSIKAQLHDGSLNFRAGRELVLMNGDEAKMKEYLAKIEAGLTVERAKAAVEPEGKKSKPGKSAEESKPTKKGISSKAAILECKEVSASITESEEGQDDYDKSVVKILGIMSKYLGGNMSAVTMKKKLREVVAGE